MEYATVALLSVPDSALVGGAVTDSKGVFKITAQDAGPYLLSVSFVGYKKFVQRVASSILIHCAIAFVFSCVIQIRDE